MIDPRLKRKVFPFAILFATRVVFVAAGLRVASSVPLSRIRQILAPSLGFNTYTEAVRKRFICSTHFGERIEVF